MVQPAEAAALASSRGQDLPVNQLAALRTRLHVWGTGAVINTDHRRGKTNMEIVTKDNSDSNKDNNRPGTNGIRFLEETGRCPITVVAGRYVLDNGRWLYHRP